MKKKMKMKASLFIALINITNMEILNKFHNIALQINYNKQNQSRHRLKNPNKNQYRVINKIYIKNMKWIMEMKLKCNKNSTIKMMIKCKGNFSLNNHVDIIYNMRMMNMNKISVKYLNKNNINLYNNQI
jgi:hypothetical protein